MREVHNDHHHAECDARRGADEQQRWRNALNAITKPELACRQREHRGNDDSAVRESDDRIRRGPRLGAEINHEIDRRWPSIDESEGR